MSADTRPIFTSIPHSVIILQNPRVSPDNNIAEYAETKGWRFVRPGSFTDQAATIAHKLISEEYLNLCFDLNFDYVENSIMNSDYIILLRASRPLPGYNPPKPIIGFCTVLIDDASIKIDVICANKLFRGAGKYIVEQVMEIGRVTSKVYISLEAVTEALGFYTKLGFGCDPLCQMKIEIPHNTEGGKRRLTHVRRKAKTVRRKEKAVSRKRKQ